LASGEYFLKPDEKKARDVERKKQLAVENGAKKDKERASAFVAPVEAAKPKAKQGEDESDKIEALKQKFKAQAQVKDKKRSAGDGDISDYVADSTLSKKKKKTKAI
ncbi:ribosomal RNA assembly protein krr1, partial [Coemansia sp. RSA 2524]